MTVNDVTQREEKDYRRNGEQCCKARAEGWFVVPYKNVARTVCRRTHRRHTNGGTAIYVAMVVNAF
jgi:hypothetical protein